MTHDLTCPACNTTVRSGDGPRCNCPTRNGAGR